jgi:hypothetical protein
MKIKTILLNCLLLIATTGFAQNHRQLSLGVRVGTNLATSDGYKNGTAGLFGVYLQTNSLKHSFLHFQLEALYKVIIINKPYHSGDFYKYTTNVELPLSIKLSPKKQFFIFGGIAPSISLLFYDDIGSVNQTKSPIHLSYFAGIGSTFYEGIGLDFRICRDYNLYRSYAYSYKSLAKNNVTTLDIALTYTFK